jgi:hypothetical protein
MWSITSCIALNFNFQKHNPQRYIRSYRDIFSISVGRAKIITICMHILLATCVLMPCPSQTSFARCFPSCAGSLYQKVARTLENIIFSYRHLIFSYSTRGNKERFQSMTKFSQWLVGKN